MTHDARYKFFAKDTGIDMATALTRKVDFVEWVNSRILLFCKNFGLEGVVFTHKEHKLFNEWLEETVAK